MDAHTAAIDELVSADSHLAAVVDRWGRPTPFRRPPTFATLVLLILEQQVSLSSAAAAFRRLEDLGPVTPASVLSREDETLRAVGFSRQKARYARALAAHVSSGDLDLAAIVELSDDDVRTALTAVPGIGPWTADVFLMSSLGRPDLWPVGDRALRIGTAEALKLPAPPDERELIAIGVRWKPRRSTAALIIWHGYLAKRGRLPISP